MNRLRIMLNNRKRFVFLAALGAVLVLLAGGANALAFVGYRVLCVPSHTINSSCYNPSPSPEYTTIQLAVNAAHMYDTILVAPGTYGPVTISKEDISLLGAQAGNDARVDRHDPTKETIVDGGGTTNAFQVSASWVVIDGFTVRNGAGGGTPAGIGVGGGCLGPQVLNNIVYNNSTGLFLAAPGIKGAIIERNLFKNNNNSTGSPAIVGVGILANEVTGLVITENEFTGNEAAAMGILATTGATITNNTSKNDGSFVIFAGSSQSQFSHNRGEKFGHAGVLPFSGNNPDAAVDIAPGNSALEISFNDLEKGEGSISNGIAFTSAFTDLEPGYSGLLFVVNNEIKGFPDYGIVAETYTGGVGQVVSSSIMSNKVYGNGMVGILIEDATLYNSAIDLYDNDAKGNANKDCEDDTGLVYGGTLGTKDYWSNNIGKLSYPRGLCTPVTLHDHDWR